MEILSRAPSDFYVGSEVLHVRTSASGRTYRICITPPVIPQQEAVGAVLSLDGDWTAGTLAGNLRGLCGNELPMLFGVSICFPQADYPIAHALRTLDMTPTVSPEVAAFTAFTAGGNLEVETGGADAFLAFILDDLKPYLVDTYHLDPAQFTLTGASLAGLFTVHALLSRPEGFSRYIPISPSVWWDDKLLLKQAEQLVATAKAPTASVALFAAELEDRKYVEAIMETYFPPEVAARMPTFMREADMLGDMARLKAILDGWQGEGFSVSSTVIPGESHQSIMGGAALSQGLRKLYGRLD